MRRRRFARWPVTRESRYGMRRCRFGEASNPGPPATSDLRGSLTQSSSLFNRPSQQWTARTMTGRQVVRRVGETEQRSVFSSTRLDSFDEASMHSTARCHSHPHKFSAEVDMDEGVPSKVPASIPTWVDQTVMNPVLCLRILVGAKWRI